MTARENRRGKRKDGRPKSIDMSILRDEIQRTGVMKNEDYEEDTPMQSDGEGDLRDGD